MSTGFRVTQRVNAYQPRVQPWEWDGGYGGAQRRPLPAHNDKWGASREAFERLVYKCI